VGASERTTDKTADAARTENRVSHTDDRKPARQTRYPRRTLRRSRGREACPRAG
jgi:hypothetical protein